MAQCGKMNKIPMGKYLLSCRYPVLIKKPEAIFRRLLSTDKEKDKDEFEVEERYKAQQGVLHDKQQSIQEESFFHKESQEQIKALKKKVKKDKTTDSDSNKN